MTLDELRHALSKAEGPVEHSDHLDRALGEALSLPSRWWRNHFWSGPVTSSVDAALSILDLKLLHRIGYSEGEGWSVMYGMAIVRGRTLPLAICLAAVVQRIAEEMK